MAARQLFNRTAPHESHVTFNLRTQQAERAFHTQLSRCSKGEKIKTTDSDCFCTE